MLNNDQASTIADDLVTQARDLRTAGLDANAQRVSVLLRSSALSRLRPHRQAELVALATRTAQSGALYVCCNVAWLAALGLSWYLLPPLHTRAVAILLTAAAALGIVVLRTVFTRRELSRLVNTERQEANSSSTAA